MAQSPYGPLQNLTLFSKPDRRPIYVWAAEHVDLPSGVYTISGLFNVHLSRYLIDPFDALQNDLIRVVTVQAPIRSGKSLLADIWLPWCIVNDPGPFMWNTVTNTLAKRHAETRTMPLLRNVAPVRNLLPLDRHKQRGQEIIFRNRMPLYVQGPAMGNLQGVGIRYLVEDELWDRPPGRHAQATGRLGDYEKLGNSKLLNIGQAGIVDDDQDVEFRAGHQAEWNVQCLHCGKWFEPLFGGSRPDGSRWGVRWDDNEKTRDRMGNWIISQVLPTVRYECPECGQVHTDNLRTSIEWNRTGKYVARNTSASPLRASFHVHSTVMRSWVELAEEFCRAMNAYKLGVLEPLIAFRQKREALPWSEEALLTSKPTATYELNTEWKDEFVRIFTLDRQADGLHWGLICAWSKSGECRRLWYGRLYSEDEIFAKALEFKVEPCRVLIDSGHEARVVYGMCVRRGWIALKGDDQRSFKHVIRRAGKAFVVERSYSPAAKADPEIGQVHEGRRWATLIRWSNPTIKDRLQRHIDQGKWLDPPLDPDDEMEKEFRRQMKGQWKTMKRHPLTGRVTWIWRDNGNDHARDCACEQVLAATILKILPDMEIEERPDSPELAAAA
jgi:hypothetical protein